VPLSQRIVDVRACPDGHCGEHDAPSARVSPQSPGDAPGGIAATMHDRGLHAATFKVPCSQTLKPVGSSRGSAHIG
jgi:hypothetical protein